MVHHSWGLSACRQLRRPAAHAAPLLEPTWAAIAESRFGAWRAPADTRQLQRSAAQQHVCTQLPLNWCVATSAVLCGRPAACFAWLAGSGEDLELRPRAASVVAVVCRQQPAWPGCPSHIGGCSCRMLRPLGCAAQSAQLSHGRATTSRGSSWQTAMLPFLFGLRPALLSCALCLRPMPVGGDSSVSAGGHRGRTTVPGRPACVAGPALPEHWCAAPGARRVVVRHCSMQPIVRGADGVGIARQPLCASSAAAAQGAASGGRRRHGWGRPARCPRRQLGQLGPGNMC